MDINDVKIDWEALLKAHQESIPTISIPECSPKIPFWERYTLSIEEAAAYFRIGENKLRKIISENKDADFVLWNGTRSQIKRKKFENYIDRLNVI
jgi:phage antirepressor YoqD-like protein